MNDDRQAPDSGPEEAESPRPERTLTPEAERALAEAEARREARESEAGKSPKEVGGRDGPDPTRYGDWEKDGTVSDF